MFELGLLYKHKGYNTWNETHLLVRIMREEVITRP
jgi:hypothetical protein